MFLKNKYTKWYYQIVNKRLSSSVLENEYGEKHHIIPRSLGGDDSKNNIIKLTAREHFICHLLLVKMVSNKNHKYKMVKAAFGMAIMNKNKINSKMYESLKHQYSEIMKNDNPSKRPEIREKISKTLKSLPKRKTNYKHSDETKKKISDAVIGRVPWNKGRKYEGGGMTGLTHSEETKALISSKMRGRKLSEQHKKAVSESLVGITRSENTRKLMSDAKKGRVHPRKVCENCGGEYSVAMYTRWHGIKCKKG